MKKINRRGFILAETLVVAVFLMVIFSMLYSNFYPLIGEYEKREAYDDVDSKYAVYWIKKLIEDSAYKPSAAALDNFNRLGYMRFECRNMADADDKQETCRLLLKELQVDNCDSSGNDCNIFITKFRIGGVNPAFKNTVESGIKRYRENCPQTQSDSNCQTTYMTSCVNGDSRNVPMEEKQERCESRKTKDVFNSSFRDYIMNLPDYSAPSLNRANYRVIAVLHHTRDYNNYNSYATIEVNR